MRIQMLRIYIEIHTLLIDNITCKWSIKIMLGPKKTSINYIKQKYYKTIVTQKVRH